MSALDIVKAAAKNSGSKKKNGAPVMEATNRLSELVSQFFEFLDKYSSINADLERLKEEILPDAQAFHDTVVKETGTVPSSIKISVDGRELQIDVAKKQYSNVGSDNEDALRAIFGRKFDEYFKTVMKIELKEEAMNESILKLIVDAVGPDNFAKYFSVTQSIAPTDKFHNDRFLNEKIHDKVEKVISEKLVRPFKPSFRG